MDSYSFNFMYEAISRKDPKYNGKFYTCVKTTKIFCIPSCKAKTPLKANVEFVTSVDKAQQLGFRPCKRCNPLNYPHFCPDWIKMIERYLLENLDRIISDDELIKLVEMDITTIRRSFKKKNGISIKKYHRKFRLEKAKELLSEGIPIDRTAMMIGYSSIKGFKHAFTKQFGELKYG